MIRLAIFEHIRGIFRSLFVYARGKPQTYLAAKCKQVQALAAKCKHLRPSATWAGDPVFLFYGRVRIIRDIIGTQSWQATTMMIRLAIFEHIRGIFRSLFVYARGKPQTYLAAMCKQVRAIAAKCKHLRPSATWAGDPAFLFYGRVRIIRDIIGTQSWPATTMMIAFAILNTSVTSFEACFFMRGPPADISIQYSGLQVWIGNLRHLCLYMEGGVEANSWPSPKVSWWRVCSNVVSPVKLWWGCVGAVSTLDPGCLESSDGRSWHELQFFQGDQVVMRAGLVLLVVYVFGQQAQWVYMCSM